MALYIPVLDHVKRASLPPSSSCLYLLVSRQNRPRKNACIIIRIFSLLTFIMLHVRGKRCSTRLTLLLLLDGGVT
jgi:hypothetical protein